MTAAGTIEIAAALAFDADGRMLLVRKRGTSAFLQPGGKIEPGETAAEALARELREEVGFVVEPASARHVGRFTAVAANEPGHRVVAEVFSLVIAGDIVPAAEIEEVAWVDPSRDSALEMAPLTRDQLLPLARRLAGQAVTGMDTGAMVRGE